jgi:hypothetical protein
MPQFALQEAFYQSLIPTVRIPIHAEPAQWWLEGNYVGEIEYQ